MSYDDTLRALGAALDLRDNETAGHSRRVTAYCLEIAKAMGVQSDELKQIERGSYLHDIGEIGIPDAILFKPAKLTEEEREIMESHARIGYDLVSSIAFLAPAAQVPTRNSILSAPMAIRRSAREDSGSSGLSFLK